MSETDNAVISAAIKVMENHRVWANQAIEQVPDEKLHVALSPDTNSIVVIMKHISGNLRSRWTDFLTSDGEKSWRDRDSEFVDTFSSRDPLIEFWEQGWSCAIEALEKLSPDDLSKTVTIRGEPHSVPLAIQRSVGHTCYHVGQILLIARILVGEPWKVITIPRGQSARYNSSMWGGSSYKPR